jgi:hypothetical protein
MRTLKILPLINFGAVVVGAFSAGIISGNELRPSAVLGPMEFSKNVRVFNPAERNEVRSPGNERIVVRFSKIADCTSLDNS